METVRPRREPGTDRLAPFTSVVISTRWASLVLSTILTVSPDNMSDNATYAWLAGMVANGVLRTFRPLRWRGTTGDIVTFVGGVAAHAAGVCVTGGLQSPLIFTLLAHIVMAGLAAGVIVALAVALTSSVAIAASDFLVWGEDDWGEALRWIGLSVLVGIVAAYGRRISGEASRRQVVAMDRLARLADANALLFSLHRVAQTLPASLDLGETIESTVARLRDLFDHDLATLLLYDETDQGWDVARVDGPGATASELPAKIPTGQLPSPLARAVAGGFLVQVSDLTGGGGLWNGAGSGLYVLLAIRNSVVGLIALEHREPHHFDRRDIELLSGYVEPAALALDNARWFARLRTVGAEEERNRLARDLHDQIGQALAYLAFELDRLIRMDQRGDALTEDLERLRDEVRRIVGEVRETLYDLRTDVSESQDIVTALRLVGRRLEARSGITVRVSSEADRRLPIPQEREFFRIGQEAMVNGERHAEASTITVSWWSDGQAAILEVVDDGHGLTKDAGRADSYGIVGMRERAASIGATLEIESLAGSGTRVRCVRDETRNRTGRPAETPSELTGS